MSTLIRNLNNPKYLILSNGKNCLELEVLRIGPHTLQINPKSSHLQNPTLLSSLSDKLVLVLSEMSLNAPLMTLQSIMPGTIFGKGIRGIQPAKNLLQMFISQENDDLAIHATKLCSPICAPEWGHYFSQLLDLNLSPIYTFNLSSAKSVHRLITTQFSQLPTINIPLGPACFQLLSSFLYLWALICMLNYNLCVCMMELDDDLLELPHVCEPTVKSNHSILRSQWRILQKKMYC